MPTGMRGGTQIAYSRRERGEYSPSGKLIAFNRIGEDGIGMWTMRAIESREKQLTFGRFDFFPDWQPN